MSNPTRNVRVFLLITLLVGTVTSFARAQTSAAGAKASGKWVLCWVLSCESFTAVRMNTLYVQYVLMSHSLSHSRLMWPGRLG